MFAQLSAATLSLPNLTTIIGLLMLRLLVPPASLLLSLHTDISRRLRSVSPHAHDQSFCLTLTVAPIQKSVSISHIAGTRDVSITEEKPTTTPQRLDLTLHELSERDFVALVLGLQGVPPPLDLANVPTVWQEILKTIFGLDDSIRFGWCRIDRV